MQNHKRISRKLAVGFFLAFWVALPASAQQAVKPYVHIIIDTSASMSPDLMPEAVAALADIFAGVGEVTFALQSFLDKSECNNECNCSGDNADCVAGDVLVGFAPDNQEDLYSWVDGHCNVGPNDDYELGAYGGGLTPLYQNLAGAHNYLYNTVRLSDDKYDCRPYVVVLITDGEENCDDCNYQNSDNDDAVDEAIAMRNHGISTYVVGFIGADFGCLDAIAAQGGTDITEAIYAEDRDDLALAFQDIIEDSIMIEVCDNVDNDCDCPGDTNDDGTICGPGDEGVDEGFEKFCNIPEGITEPTLCEDPGDPCDDVDDNCHDGIEDEERNACGGCGDVPEEVCDGEDNDCDGFIDEDVCDEECDPEEEVCDGVDNDCDGEVDEDYPLDGTACGEDEGPCEPGRWRCINGEEVCVGGIPPRDEVCDGEDNDCDGEVDNEAPCPGESVCIEGDCRRPCDPMEEFPCTVGFFCDYIPEAEDRYSYVPEGNYCMPSECMDCAPNESCVDNACVDLCEDVTCEDGLKCIEGECLGCRHFACPEGQECINDQCVADPCRDVECPEMEACVQGECLALCNDADCPEGEKCNDEWQCAPEGCEQSCGPDEYCDGDSCVTDPCSEITCDVDEVCSPLEEECIANPCLHIDCPSGYKCTVSKTAVAKCVEQTNIRPGGSGDDEKDSSFVQTAGGGGVTGCSIRPLGSPATVLFGLYLFMLVALVIRRRI